MGNDFRVGIGNSVCHCSEYSSVRLAGIQISLSESGTGNPAPDCLIKAISDALLGSAGLGGVEQIPDLDEKSADKETELFRDAERRVHYSGYKIVNIDSTISTNINSIKTRINLIRENLALIIFLKPDQVNLKVNIFKETESDLSKYRVEAMAVVLLKKR